MTSSMVKRLNALKAFHSCDLELLKVDDAHLRIPASLRAVPAFWSGKRFDGLTPEQRGWFEDYKIDVMEITPESGDDQRDGDEIRDLFIRLQGGTALKPQQVRDAWPGEIGPFIWKLAGRFDRAGRVLVFQKLDRRGRRDEEVEDGKDPYVGDRTMCAQLLCWFLGRERDYGCAPPLGPEAIHGLYQANSGLSPESADLRRFTTLLENTDRVFEKVTQDRANGGAEGRRRKVIAKRDLFVVFSLLQDISRGGQVKIDEILLGRLANAIPPDGIPSGRGEGERFRMDIPTVLLKAYETWRATLPEHFLVRLDNVRLFTEAQQDEIYSDTVASSLQLMGVVVQESPVCRGTAQENSTAHARSRKPTGERQLGPSKPRSSGGSPAGADLSNAIMTLQCLYSRDLAVCRMCKKPVERDEAEYDHYPTPYRDGGKTEVSNGSLVHVKCHTRGRPVGS